MKLAHDYVFFRPRNPYAGGLDNESTKLIFRTIARIAGIELYSHRLRYTFAVTLWKAGVEIFIISRLLGHSKLETTMIYLKITEDDFYKKWRDQTKGVFY